MKPATIVWFDRLFWLGAVLAVITMVMNFGQILDAGGPVNEESRRTIAALAGVGGFALVMGVYVGLWFFISQQASNGARWIFAIIMAVIFVINIVGMPAGGSPGVISSATIDIVRFAIWVGCAILLFVGGSPKWFREAREANHDGLA